jgi:hypothetical protein
VSVRYLFIARIPPAGVADFQAYESSVLPLLAEHAARLEHRFRAADGCLEVHVLHFPTAEALTAYRDDPRRAELAPALDASGATTELHLLTESGPS